MLVTITGMIGAYAIYQQTVISQEYGLRERVERGVQSVLIIDGLAARLTGNAERYRLLPDPEQLVAMEEARRAIELTCDKYVSLAITDTGRKLYDDTRENARAMKPELERLKVAGASLHDAKAQLYATGNALTTLVNTLLADARARGGGGARPRTGHRERGAAGPPRVCTLRDQLRSAGSSGLRRADRTGSGQPGGLQEDAERRSLRAAGRGRP
jgi:hypothetical protein